MGNTNNADAQRLQLLYSAFTPTKLKHDQFGEYTLLQSKTDPKEKLILKEYTYTDEHQFKKSKRTFEHRQAIQSDYLLRIHHVYHLVEKQLCGQFFKIYLVIEHPSTKLESVHLSPQDYWPVLFGYIRALETLQKNQIPHEQLKMRTLYLPPKLADPSLFEHNTNFQSIVQNPRQICIYLSPELSNAVKNSDWQPTYNPYKSDVFILGICLTQAILKVSMNDCFRMGILQEAVLEQKLTALHQQVCPQMAEVITLMLSQSELRRPDFIQLSQLLDMKYQESQMPRHDFKKSRAVKKPSMHADISQNTTSNSIKRSEDSMQQAAYFQSQYGVLMPLALDVPDSLGIVQLSQKQSEPSKFDENIDPLDQFMEDSAVNAVSQRAYNLPPLRETTDMVNRSSNHLQLKLSDIKQKQNPQGEFKQSLVSQAPQFSLPFDLPGKRCEFSGFTSQCQEGDGEGEQFVHEEYQDGSKYHGMKLNGMRHGLGVFYYKDGGYYDGNWQFNHMHGQGVLYYSNGNPAYEGSWSQDKFQGYGILHNEVPAQQEGPFDYRNFDLVEDYWVRYEGEFNDDNKEGQGTLFLSNGERFSGQFLKDYINGFGLFYQKNNKIIEGRWLNNKLVK